MVYQQPLKDWVVMIRISFILILCFSLAMAQDEDRKEKTENRTQPSIFHASGKMFSQVFGRTKRPKIIVDTVRFVGSAYASLELNSYFSRGIHSVSASGNNNMFIVITQILEDSTDTINRYAAMPTSNGRRVIIKSSSATDSSKVSIMIILN